MPRYVFSISQDGVWTPGEPVDLPDDEAARSEAVRTVREMMSGMIPGTERSDVEIEVRRDETKVVVARMKLDVSGPTNP